MWLVVIASCIVALNILLGGRLTRAWVGAVLAFAALLTYGLLIAEARGIHDPASVKSQAVALLAVFSIFMVLTYIVLSGVLSGPKAARYVVAVTVLYAGTKCLVEVLLILGVWSVHEVLGALGLVFGVGFVHLDTGTLFRIGLPADLILPVVFMYLVAGWGHGESARTLSLPFRVAAGVAIVGALIVAYSRYLWFVTTLLLFYSFMVTSVRPRPAHVGWLAAGVALMWAFLNPLLARFGGAAAVSSDSARAQMLGSLTERINEHPLLGIGMGGYLEGFVRIPDSPWYYELQWLALWMQFGLVGLIVLLLLCGSLVPRTTLRSASLGIAVAYALWLGSALVNGFLLTSSAGVVFFAYWVMMRTENATSTCVLSSAVSSDQGER